MLYCQRRRNTSNSINDFLKCTENLAFIQHNVLRHWCLQISACKGMEEQWFETAVFSSREQSSVSYLKPVENLEWMGREGDKIPVPRVFVI